MEVGSGPAWFLSLLLAKISEQAVSPDSSSGTSLHPSPTPTFSSLPLTPASHPGDQNRYLQHLLKSCFPNLFSAARFGFCRFVYWELLSPSNINIYPFPSKPALLPESSVPQVFCQLYNNPGQEVTTEGLRLCFQNPVLPLTLQDNFEFLFHILKMRIKSCLTGQLSTS